MDYPSTQGLPSKLAASAGGLMYGVQHVFNHDYVADVVASDPAMTGVGLVALAGSVFVVRDMLDEVIN